MQSVRWYILLFVLAVAGAMDAQTIISGLVKDRQTGRALSRVSISAEGGEPRTVTNDDGRFELKVTRQPRYLLLSHLGYKTCRQTVDVGRTAGELTILMTPTTVQLSEVIISVADPYDIVRSAMQRIEANYPRERELVRCFYRETARRGSRFISIAEAVMDMYKTGYNAGPQYDAIAILKGRRLMSLKARDTLGVKVQGGPVMPLMADVAKNPDYMLNLECLSQCYMYSEVPQTVDDRLHYVVRIEPHEGTPWPLMGGRLYIDQQSFAISRAELHLDVRDWRKASQYMLVNKPATLRFRPRELTMTLVYHTGNDGITRLSYLRNEMRFNCDWKRRLFASTFTTVSEMVVTDRLDHGDAVRRPRGRDSFGLRERFYDRVEYFNDPDFWADYNIIAPTESLQYAITKLRKTTQQK